MVLTRRGAVAIGFAAALIFSAGVMAQQKPAPTQKYNDAQVKEIQAISKAIDAIEDGETAPNDLSLTWVRADLLKAQTNFQYVPFSVTIDPTKLTGRNISVYWRVVPKSGEGGAAPAPAAGKGNASPYAYEYLTSSTIAANETGPVRINRSFTVGPGSYDVYVAVKEPASNQRNAPAPKMSILVQSFEVPNFWDGELATSSVLVTDRVEPLAAPLTPQQAIERPYALGNREIVPSLSMQFAKEAQLTMFLLVYNPSTDAGNKPDITVDYNFYTKQGTGEKFFNRTPPHNLNAQTLDPAFNLSLGHQLPSGQTIGLKAFPAGDYRLEVKVTDNLAKKSVTKEVTFTVLGA